MKTIYIQDLILKIENNILDQQSYTVLEFVFLIVTCISIILLANYVINNKTFGILWDSSIKQFFSTIIKDFKTLLISIGLLAIIVFSCYSHIIFDIKRDLREKEFVTIFQDMKIEDIVFIDENYSDKSVTYFKKLYEFDKSVYFDVKSKMYNFKNSGLTINANSNKKF